MQFNSLPFLLFFPIVCCAVWAIRNLRARNSFLLVASYFFYMSWEPRFGLLLLFCSVTAYFGGIALGRRKRGLTLAFAIGTLLANLFFFKYLGFASSVVVSLFDALGIRFTIPLPQILLPVGISFYTFQAIGYLVDVYNRKVAPEKNFIDFTLFVSFFPQLVAGPIERAGNLIHQIKVLHKFDYSQASIGARQMLWGYFLKLVVADRLALYSDPIFRMSEAHNGSSLLLATFFFSIQIYCDFAGYSLIAIGCSKMMGFNLMKNFDCPYFSCSVTEFWRRWHISLSKWLKDYVYIPLGGNRCGRVRHKLNILLTFLISGIWHGANWTFLIWGLLHGVFQVFEKITGLDKPSSRLFFRILQRLCTFSLVTFAWIFFRSKNLEGALDIVKKILYSITHGFAMPAAFELSTMAFAFMAIAALFCKDLLDTFLPRQKAWLMGKAPVRYCICLVICLWILTAGVFDNGQFIYFQF